MPQNANNSNKGGARGKGKNPRHPFRTNTHCTQCKTELRKNEHAVCDECRMTALGWKKS